MEIAFVFHFGCDRSGWKSMGPTGRYLTTEGGVFPPTNLLRLPFYDSAANWLWDRWSSGKATAASTEDIMQPENATDHIALLSLMIAGTLIKRLEELGQLDEATARQLHKLVVGVRTHAHSRGLNDLDILFDNVDRALGQKLGSRAAG